MIKFPAEFLWGSATSAYQVEGGIENNDWAASKRIPAAGRACDHYNRYKADFLLARQVGHNAHRISIEWSRVQPEEGKWDDKELEHYREVLKFLKDNGFTTFVTLHHFTNPLWVARQGGWLNKKTIQDFAAYAEKIAQELGELIDFWITINEPNVYVFMSYKEGIWPPFEKSLIKTYRVYKSMLKAHNKAYERIRQHYSESKIGFTQNISLNEGFFRARLDEWMNIDFPYGRTMNDFVGLNHYFYHPRKSNVELPKTDKGWPIYPRAIYEVLGRLKKLNLPIYITENGLADAKDTMRADYIREYLKEVHRAISEGADVRGYLYWSLMDNYEWPVKAGETGYESKFGLIEIDFADPRLSRKIRASARVYAEICRNNEMSIR